MFNLGPLELVAIFIVALLVFGPQKLPEIGRQVGKAVREFRKFQTSLQSEFRDVLDDPPPGPIVPGPAPTATATVDPATNTTVAPAPDGEHAPGRNAGPDGASGAAAADAAPPAGEGSAPDAHPR